MSEDRLSLLKHKMKEKAEECVAIRRVLNQLDEEYMALEGQYLRKSRELESEK